MDETREAILQMRQEGEAIAYPPSYDDEEFAAQRALYARQLFDELKKQGFTDDQALFLTGHLS